MTVKDILKKCKYQVIVKNIPDVNGCIIHFPKILIFREKIKVWTAAYMIYEDLIEYSSNVNNEKEKYSLKIPSYAQRLFVETHLWKSCSVIKYGMRAVNYYKDNEEVQFLTDLLETVDQKKEMEFISLFNEAGENGFQPRYDTIIENLGFKEGYLACRALLEES